MIINENNMLIKYFEEDIDIVKEKHQVSKSNQIQLEYIPNKDLDISVYNESKEEITEFELGDVGVITFSNDLSKAIVYVDYTAIGKWMISSEKVYINYTNRDEVLETLEDLILQQYEIIEQVKVVGDVQTIITKMQGNIDNLRELYDIVLNNETILENIKVRIEECIAEKDRMVNALNDVISTANTTKQALEQATNTANTTKDDIVNTTNTCKSEINNLISGKKTEMTSFTNEKKEELTTTSTGCVNNVNTAISNADSKIDELNEWVANNGDIVDLNNKINTKQDKTDDNLTTTSKEVVAAINEINEKVDYLDSFKIVYSDKGTDRGYRKHEDGYCRAWGSGIQNIAGNALDITVAIPYSFKNTASCSVMARGVDNENKPINLITQMSSSNQVRLVYPSTMTPQLANGAMSWYVCVEGF